MKDSEERACLLIEEFYKNIDEVFLGYFVSLIAPETWRSKLDQEAKEYKHLWIAEIGLNDEEAEEAAHILSDGEFHIYSDSDSIVYSSASSKG
ncbi:hypothetical protein RHABOEDO_000287 [Candidatus Rhabdochlamydia oedothoracis]|uniref:Uncharacterized protein n=1 Tax=Candidatus Rhabdochlamydia oedothoracis TaxID=2720720 RepID=A0ABX8UZ92_9BACT|nr:MULTISPECIES: hypothetical protein [Rhabdochlamydia]KAG6559635.1 hypothetical protein RHOW815_000351 [Candidatus Rhabdochlamydia sp. W815]QYF48176.1 hypothetical protein RHABOEDO_000287 [Candidatus Rhabdochlamydia oedothoracis]